jgi:selenide,water dikinase
VVGLKSPDDAAIWKLDEKRGLVLTTDFFTPVVDDPFDYGRIAAANSLSDIYAMGGAPFLALNIAALPPDLDPTIGQQILRGAAEVAKSAGVVIAGGHTVQDKEPKFGLVVAGFVDLAGIFTKAGAKTGDKLYLTKPLGFGSITTALKREIVQPEDLAEAVIWMVRLNKSASLAASKNQVRCATDITGYSFLGHAQEMAAASQVGLQFEFSKIPILQNALPYAQQMIFPGGAYDNLHYFGHDVVFSTDIAEYQRMLLFDPQTSGGLLIAVPDAQVTGFEAEMNLTDEPFWRVGEVVNGSGIQVR